MEVSHESNFGLVYAVGTAMDLWCTYAMCSNIIVKVPSMHFLCIHANTLFQMINFYLIYTKLGPDWSMNPSGLGKNQNFGTQVDRHTKKGSPVVPGSLEKVMEDSDSILYTVTVLRSMYEVSSIEVFLVCTYPLIISSRNCMTSKTEAQPDNSIIFHFRLDTMKGMNSSLAPKSTSLILLPRYLRKNATSFVKTSPTTPPNRARQPWLWNSFR